MFSRKLRALQYPDTAADLADDAALQKLVVWLEQPYAAATANVAQQPLPA